MDSCVKAWLRWEEVVVSNDRGRRKVHYYVRDATGGRYLAVVGREKSARHMSYAVTRKFVQSLMRMSATEAPSDLRWRSRRQVVDWLSSIVSDCMPYVSSPPFLDGYLDNEASRPANINISKNYYSGKLGQKPKEFSWLGPTWECRNRRKHYQSFDRNGITISLHAFVYIMAEHQKRLVAYVEDLYEDSRANNMVVVRWFHKVDEVCMVLPPDTNDGEIFFSLCLQDLSVECIDGLAAVLSAQDFEKFQKESRHRHFPWEPYLCRKQIDNDDLKPFDVTQVQGYWNQDLLHSIYSSSLKLRLKITSQSCSLDVENNSCGDYVACKGKPPYSTNGSVDVEGPNSHISKLKGFSILNVMTPSITIPIKGLVRQKSSLRPHLTAPGCQIELLSQDSGIRGCWFRCMVLKRHHDKIKVQYRDVQDADGTASLEEWVSTSRISAPDKLGIRISGRTMVRPSPLHRCKGLCDFVFGKVVDAWWHDGWWEGIVINKECEGKFHVYFPGERKVSIFSHEDLRPSQDWVDNKWNPIKDRPDIANMLLADLDCERFSDCVTFQASASNAYQTEPERRRECPPPSGNGGGACSSELAGEPLLERRKISWPDLIRDCHHDGLNWNSTRKRRIKREKFTEEVKASKRHRFIDLSMNCNDFVLTKSMQVTDQKNCKSGSDPLFGTPMTLCTSLVMTR